MVAICFEIWPECNTGFIAYFGGEWMQYVIQRCSECWKRPDFQPNTRHCIRRIFLPCVNCNYRTDIKALSLHATFGCGRFIKILQCEVLQVLDTGTHCMLPTRCTYDVCYRVSRARVRTKKPCDKTLYDKAPSVKTTFSKKPIRHKKVDGSTA